MDIGINNSFAMEPLEKKSIIIGIGKLKKTIINGIKKLEDDELRNKLLEKLNWDIPTHEQLKSAIELMYNSSKIIDKQGRTYRQRYDIWHTAFSKFLQKKITKLSIDELKATVNDLWKFNIKNKNKMISDFKKIDKKIMCIGNHFGWSPDVLPPLVSEDGTNKGYDILMDDIKCKYDIKKLSKHIGQETEQFNPHNIYQICTEKVLKEENIPVKFVLRSKGDTYNDFYSKSDEILLQKGLGVKTLTENLEKNQSNIFIFSEGGFRMLKSISSGAIVASLNAGEHKIALFAAPDPFISPAISEIDLYYIKMIDIPKNLKSDKSERKEMDKFLNKIHDIIKKEIDKHSKTDLYKDAVDIA